MLTGTFDEIMNGHESTSDFSTCNDHAEKDSFEDLIESITSEENEGHPKVAEGDE